MTKTETIGAILFSVSLVIVLTFIFSLPVMLLWNGCLVPAIPGIESVSWLQAWGISILCGLLFKNNTFSR